MLDIQKASMWKRISAYILDIILLAIAAVGVAFLLSAALNFTGQFDKIDQIRVKYEAEYGVKLDITEEEYEKLSDEEKEKYDAADEALNVDNDFKYASDMLIHLSSIILIFGLLAAYLITEVTVPLIFKNGQTVGKKIFGIAVIREDGVRLSPTALFIRTVLGKYTVETMVPILVSVVMLTGAMGYFGVTVLGIIVAAQLMLLFMTPNHQSIHDKFAGTVVVDLSSQLIFDSVEALLEYKNRLQEQKAKRSEK